MNVGSWKGHGLMREYDFIGLGCIIVSSSTYHSYACSMHVFCSHVLNVSIMLVYGALPMTAYSFQTLLYLFFMCVRSLLFFSCQC